MRALRPAILEQDLYYSYQPSANFCFVDCLSDGFIVVSSGATVVERRVDVTGVGVTAVTQKERV